MARAGAVVLLAFLAISFFGDNNVDALRALQVSSPRWLHGWQNRYDQHLKMQCYSGALTGVRSMHSNSKEDRLFQFACSHASRTSSGKAMRSHSCLWSHWTWWDAHFKYYCPSNTFMAGWESYHNNGREDRRMRFQCCKGYTNLVMKSCYDTGYRNAFDQSFSFNPSKNYLIAGVESYHDNGKEDRRFAFHVCKPFVY